jgi:hypothetical protein
MLMRVKVTTGSCTEAVVFTSQEPSPCKGMCVASSGTL